MDKSKREKIMSDTYEYQREKYLPDTLKEYFKTEKENLKKSRDIIESFTAPTGSSIGEQALMKMFKSLAKAVFSDINIDTFEKFAVSHWYLKDKYVKNILKTLDGTGSDINQLKEIAMNYKEREPILDWVDKYVNHVKTTEE
ncbi:MAG: hypothetical protein R1F52_05125 [Candidatus Nitrosoabyssus spongiisocia]|nr:MAG: hypothetical protein R1F52_05125 [Nitrosopumilaceae archaeon AB1(1)]